MNAVNSYNVTNEVAATESGPSPQEALLTSEVRRVSSLSKNYEDLESALLDRMQDMIEEDDDLTAANLMSFVKALKELRAMAPAPVLLPQQQNTQPTIQIQFLNSSQLTVTQ